MRRHLSTLIALCGFVVVAGVVAAYVLDHQRLRWPWEDVMRVEAELPTGQAVSPGQGQAVEIAGVKVGEIGAVRLEDGRAVLRLDIDPNESGPIYRDTRLALKPKTGLNDMSVQLDPGTRAAGRLHDGDRLGIAATEANVQPDEVLAALDADTRRYLKVLLDAGGRGLRGNGERLRAVLRASQPTLARTARVTRAIADRRDKLRRLVTNLRLLAGATAEKDGELARLVDASAAAFTELGEREADLNAAVGSLPGALAATRGALHDARGLAAEAVPALEALRPAARRLGPSLEGARPLLRTARPVLRDRLRPLVREATPLLADLRPALSDLNAVAPPLERTGHELNYVVNELGHNPPGKEEGYLFWTAWFFHNANSILSIEDAQGATWRGLVMVGCSSVGSVVGASPVLEAIGRSPVCPKGPKP